MSPDTVFAKSPKGIEEIETRSHKLGSRLRQVLIRIDGQKTLDELVAEAGDMGETLVEQIEELERQGFLTDTETAEPVTVPRTEPLPSTTLVPAPAPVAAKPAAAPSPEALEYNSPLKFRLSDLLVEAMGMETGSVGAALNRCRNREDLTRWVDLAAGPIEQAAGKAKAKTFYKQAKKLVGG